MRRRAALRRCRAINLVEFKADILIELGRQALRLLVARMEEKPEGQQKKIIPAELIIRGSTKKA